MNEIMTHVPLGGIHMLHWRVPAGRILGLMLALLVIVSVGLTAVTGTIDATRIAYCATGESNPGEALHVTLLQQGADDPVRMHTGETTVNGCGEFFVIPRELPVMIVVWSDDGYSSGSTGWIDPDAISGTLAIELKSQASPTLV